MTTLRHTIVCVGTMIIVACGAFGGTDPRNIHHGSVIPDEGYCDQPYVVITRDGNWLCTFTTGKGIEGQLGQHVVASISSDKGKTWSTPPIDIEPADGPEASWVMPLVTPFGRVYAFYDYNGDRISTLGDRKNIRADMLGWYVYKYSDDNGRTWSDKRYRLPVRLTACDRTNDWQGRVQIMWGIGKPVVVGPSVLFGFTKLGRYMLDDGEGWFFRSDNILTERDVEKIEWQMLPEGEHGIRAPEFGSVQEEHNLVGLSDGSLYCIYRTTTGYPCHVYSRDGGKTWTRPEHATYTPGGRKIKTPRACPRLWKARNDKFLLWYHNHSGKDFDGRNPAWVTGGVEKDGRIHWSQPEILLWDPDPKTRMSYPDLVQQDGRCWVTETQKEIARVHEVDPSLFEGLWNQGRAAEVAKRGLLLEQAPVKPGSDVRRVRLPNLVEAAGFTIDIWLQLDDLKPKQVILDGRNEHGSGVRLLVTEKGTVGLELRDGKKLRSIWDTDPGVIKPGRLHHLVAIVEGGPKIIMFVVDGVLCDGGEHRQFGWGRFDAGLTDLGDTLPLYIPSSLKGAVKSMRVYARPLRVSETVSNYRAGLR